MDIHLYLMVSVQLNPVMKAADLQHMSSEEPPGSRVPGPGSRLRGPALTMGWRRAPGGPQTHKGPPRPLTSRQPPACQQH